MFGGDSDDDMEGMFGGTPTKAPQEIKKQTPAKPLVNDEEEVSLLFFSNISICAGSVISYQ